MGRKQGHCPQCGAPAALPVGLSGQQDPKGENIMTMQYLCKECGQVYSEVYDLVYRDTVVVPVKQTTKKEERWN